MTISIANPADSDSFLFMESSNPSFLTQWMTSANAANKVDLNKVAKVTTSISKCPISKYEIMEASGVTAEGASTSGCGDSCVSPQLSFTGGNAAVGTFKIKITAQGGVNKISEKITLYKKCAILAKMLKTDYTKVNNYDIKNDVEKTSIDLPFMDFAKAGECAYTKTELVDVENPEAVVLSSSCTD